MELYSHNKEAYDKVMQSFETNSRAAVVHATGTGKSYIIAAVANHFERVLVVAPNNFVLNETRKVCHSGCEFRTYASVMCNDVYANRYDLIVLDEFHRGGAEKWETGVRRMIDANPDAKIFGTSATNIRYLDNARNMADELFDGNVVSRMTLREAIDTGVLPEPTYVSSIYSIDETVIKRRNMISNARSVKDKDVLCRKLYGIAHNWSNAGGVSRIIRKYFSSDMHRVIVFCSKVSRAAKAREMLSEWFGLAGFKKVRYYNIDYTEKRLDREMKDFQSPLVDYDLKVAISVNMLNEGVHIDHVDGVILLRSTISRIIIEQQVGRCLTSNNTGIRPVVLDLVNNIDSIRYEETYKFTTGEHDNVKNEEKDEDVFPFKVIDECRDIRVLFDQLDREIDYLHSYTKEECASIALKYKTRKEFYENERIAYKCCYRHKWLDELCSHMIKRGKTRTKEECIAVASKYKTKREFERNDGACYWYACKHGWVEECCRNMIQPNKKWTKEDCISEALKYKSKIEFQQNSKNAYAAAKYHKWLDEVCAHMKSLHVIWTKQKCLGKAKKCGSKSEFKKKYRTAYIAANRYGWYKECCENMKLLTK